MQLGSGTISQAEHKLSATQTIWHASPNFGPRRDGLKPELIVLHYTAMNSARAALDRLCDPAFEVSAHYLIGGDGTCWQMVAEDMRAWHAGQGSWRGQGDINSRSIGIELDNRGDHPFSEALMATLERLLKDITARWAIPPQGVIAHSDMAPGRKCDPGWKFDWQRLAKQGMSVWPGADVSVSDPSASVQDVLTDIGYPKDVVLPEERLAAFRMRFHPCGCGPENATDMARALAIALRFGIDRSRPTA